jgi:hypothetical protein
MKFCETRQYIDRHSYVAQYISLALLSNGVTALLGSDDLLAAFFSGTAFAWDSHFNKQTADSVFSTVVDLLFNVAIFVFIVSLIRYLSCDPEDQCANNVSSGCLDAVFRLQLGGDFAYRLATRDNWHLGSVVTSSARRLIPLQMDP